MRALVLALLCSCGYSLGQAERAPNGMRRLYVNQVMDNGTDVGPAGTLTRALRKRVGASNSAVLVTLPEAEGVVEGRIESIVDQPAIAAAPATPGQNPSVPAFSVTVNGSIRVVDHTAKIIWQAAGVLVSESYLAGLPSDCGPNPCGKSVLESALTITESNRRRALERAAERLGNELYTRLMEGF